MSQHHFKRTSLEYIRRVKRIKVTLAKFIRVRFVEN